MNTTACFPFITDAVFQTPDYRIKRSKEWRGLTIHHTGGHATDKEGWEKLGDSMKSWLTTKDSNYLSAHFQINRDGALIQICDPRFYEAFHAGRSSHWCVMQRQVVSDWNKWAIGIELLGDGNKAPFSSDQYETLIDLTVNCIRKFPTIHPKNILGHDEIAPGRKVDPGKFFDWEHYLKGVYDNLLDV